MKHLSVNLMEIGRYNVVTLELATTGHGHHSAKNVCVILYIVCFVSSCVLFVCKCVLYCCHGISPRLQFNKYIKSPDRPQTECASHLRRLHTDHRNSVAAQIRSEAVQMLTRNATRRTQSQSDATFPTLRTSDTD